MKNALSILCLALAFMVAAPASAGCGKGFKPFSKLFGKHKAACGSQAPLESVAASVVAAPAAPAAAVTVLQWAAPACQGGKCNLKVRVK